MEFKTADVRQAGTKHNIAVRVFADWSKRDDSYHFHTLKHEGRLPTLLQINT